MLPRDITVGALIRRLRMYDPDAVVRLAINPLFPFSHFLGDLIDARDEDGCQALFLAEAGQQGMLPPFVAQALSWHPPTQAPPRARRRATRPEGPDRPLPHNETRGCH